MKIDKIDKEVMRIGNNNGLKIKDIQFADKYIKNNFNASKAYKEISPKANYMTTRRKGHDKATNGNIAKTVIEVMESNDLTDDNLIKTHIDIRDSAKKDKQYSTARSTNRDFMEIKGLLKENIQNSSTTNILNLNISELEEKDIRGRLLDIIGK